MRDLRDGACPLCEGRQIVTSKLVRFGQIAAERRASLVYGPHWANPRRQTPTLAVGPMTLVFCRRCGFSQTFVEGPGELPVDGDWGTALSELPGQNPGRRRLDVHTPVLSIDDRQMAMVWSEGPAHRIDFTRPFEVTLARAMAREVSGPVADVHMRVWQSREEAIEVTLCLTDAPWIQSLPALSVLWPRIEGRRGGEVLARVRRAMRAQGGAWGVGS